tara:strand:- start:289 stop:609 length:321 start_codon:yes stop_codon:yes gene_type:complete
MRLILLLLPITFFTEAKSDMDYICYINLGIDRDMEVIEQRCVRNNILSIIGIYYTGTSDIIRKYCRFDREIVITEYEYDDIKFNQLDCVLYSVKPRYEKEWIPPSE